MSMCIMDGRARVPFYDFVPDYEWGARGKSLRTLTGEFPDDIIFDQLQSSDGALDACAKASTATRPHIHTRTTKYYRLPTHINAKMP